MGRNSRLPLMGYFVHYSLHMFSYKISYFKVYAHISDGVKIVIPNKI